MLSVPHSWTPGKMAAKMTFNMIVSKKIDASGLRLVALCTKLMIGLLILASRRPKADLGISGLLLQPSVERRNVG